MYDTLRRDLRLDENGRLRRIFVLRRRQKGVFKRKDVSPASPDRPVSHSCQIPDIRTLPQEHEPRDGRQEHAHPIP